MAGTVYVYSSHAATGRPATVCSTPRPTIQVGSTGGCVYYAQWVLNNYFGQSLALDANFGPLTQTAVKRFQAIGGLSATGVVDATTWQHIDSSILPGLSGDYRAACTGFKVVNHATGGVVSPLALSSQGAYSFELTVKNTGRKTWQTDGYNPASHPVAGVSYGSRFVNTHDVTQTPPSTEGAGGPPSTVTVAPGQSVTLGKEWFSTFPHGAYIEAYYLNYPGTKNVPIQFGPECHALLYFN